MNSITVAATKQHNAKLVEASRNANFTLSANPGRPTFHATTSAAHAFTPDKLKFKSSNMTDVQDMRSANFKMGFEKATNYNTTTDYNNRHMNEMSKPT